MTSSILFLVSPGGDHNDNHLRLPDAFTQAGWQVGVCAHDDLQYGDGQIKFHGICANTYQIIWPVGLGPQATFLDRAALLGLVPQNKLITPMRAVLELHGKAAWLRFAPLSLVSAHTTNLVEFARQLGGEWVLKPAAGSFGQHVFHIKQPTEIEAATLSRSGYWILQRYIADIVAGEVRTLICGSTILASYRRVPRADALTANLATDADMQVHQLSEEEITLVARIHNELRAHNVGFAAIDTCGGYLIEVNLANPGGLATLTNLYQHDYAADLVNCVSKIINERSHLRSPK